MSVPLPERSRRERHQTRRGVRRGRAFTLLEMLVVVSIIGALLSLLLPAIGKVRREMTKLKCASNVRTITMKLQLFVEGNSVEGRGDSERLGRRRFRISDFQESLYHIDEFWDLGQAGTGKLNSSNTPMLCPSGPEQLTKRQGFPCSSRAITPVEDVTLAFNMRLHRGVMDVKGSLLLAPVSLTKVRADILNHPYVPLVVDVDGEAAAARGLEPFYTAPPRPDTNDPYSGGRYWMPSFRHGGRTNVGFVGGHVLSSDEPEAQRWNWDYQADAGRR